MDLRKYSVSEFSEMLDREPGRKNIAERRKKMHTSTFEKSRASPLRNKPQKVF